MNTLGLLVDSILSLLSWSNGLGALRSVNTVKIVKSAVGDLRGTMLIAVRPFAAFIARTIKRVTDPKRKGELSV